MDTVTLIPTDKANLALSAKAWSSTDKAPNVAVIDQATARIHGRKLLRAGSARSRRYCSVAMMAANDCGIRSTLTGGGFPTTANDGTRRTSAKHAAQRPASFNQC